MKFISLPQLPKRKAIRTTLLLLLLLELNACSYFIDSATESFSEHLTQAVLNHNDPLTVAAALPAYLLMQEASTIDNQENATLYLSTARLYGAYLNLVPEDPERKRHLSRKSLDFALQGLCIHATDWCDIEHQSFDRAQALLQQSGVDDVSHLFSAATAWAAWIQANKDDWNAVAQLARVKAIMRRILELNESYKQGSAHLYMAVMESLLPENLGGNPDQARQHFERAMQLAPANLMTPVLYAKHYARMVFDRDLHDKLLRRTLDAQTVAPDLTLINTLAQQQARQLLDTAEDYF
ncbi:MAG: TRAP transporter TatT component family protein [Methylomonas sp.]|nr:TRAP transporter TatT component family protein [Methylomonas sp.]